MLTHPFPSRQSGIAMIEALVAIAVFAFGVLGVIAMQAAMIQATTEADYRVEAAQVAQRKVSAIWASANRAAELEADTPVAELPNGLRTTTLINLTDYQIVVNWTVPGGSQRTYRMIASP